MTIVSISRKKICEAIEKEPTTTLAAGEWIQFESEGKVKSKHCSVCAVGAVMRNALLDRNQDAEAVHDASLAATKFGNPISLNPEHQAEQGHYMSSLSSFFEREYSERDIWMFDPGTKKHREEMKKVKKDCIAFVKKNFPAKIEIDIDGAKPAKDVKVLVLDCD